MFNRDMDWACHSLHLAHLAVTYQVNMVTELQGFLVCVNDAVRQDCQGALASRH